MANTSTSTLELYLVPAAFSLLALFGVVGNLLVILVILQSRRLRTRLNLFIVNIAVSDLIFTALYGPVSAVSVARWGGLRDHAVCVVTGIVGLLSCYESAVLIAMSRCVRITKSHRYDELFSRKRCVLFVSVSWVVAVFLTTPMLAGFGTPGFNPILLTCDYDAVASFIFFVSFVLPFTTICNVIIIVSYAMIYRKVKASSSRVRGNRTDENKIPPIVWSQIKNMAAIYIALNICVTPEVIMNIIAHETADNMRVLNLVVRIVFTCNSCVNPIIYTTGNKEFRTELKTLWGRVFHGDQKHEPNVAEKINMKTLSLVQQDTGAQTPQRFASNIMETRL
ncbi:melatonin receptor type 1A-like [Branchiostoma floridae]|uniref:Melatonin receptor type 1A-like n=1 Tax=Branchiostoma floridae TaxID=7739 RepID=A0A9J7LLX0_BRAFL|nr:melatonin receptor type 1A-like [Branchiostoma floridae]